MENKSPTEGRCFLRRPRCYSGNLIIADYRFVGCVKSYRCEINARLSVLTNFKGGIFSSKDPHKYIIQFETKTNGT